MVSLMTSNNPLENELESADERTRLLSHDQRHGTEHNNRNTSRNDYGATSSFCTSCKLRRIDSGVANDAGLQMEGKRKSLPTSPVTDEPSSVADLPSCTSDRVSSMDSGLEDISSRRKWRKIFGVQPRSQASRSTATAGGRGRWYDFVSLRLRNSGSVARDHLASERTFLAYMRTSLAVTSAGVALVQLLSISEGPNEEIRRIRNLSRPLGAGVIGIGLYILVIGVIRYFTIQSSLVKGYFPVAKVAVVSIAFVFLTLMTVVFSALFTYRVEFGGEG